MGGGHGVAIGEGDSKGDLSRASLIAWAAGGEKMSGASGVGNGYRWVDGVEGVACSMINLLS